MSSMYKVYLAIILLFFPLSFIFSRNSFAEDNFETDASIEYKVNDNGLSSVTNVFTLRNLKSELQVKSFVFTLRGVNPKNVKAFENGNELVVFQTQENKNTIFTVNFPEKVAGVGKYRTFILSYDEESFAVKSGEIWEVNIPKIDKDNIFDKLNITLSIPLSFGDEAYITPEPSEINKDTTNKIYVFDKSRLVKNAITAVFGKSQIYSFNLMYRIENPVNKKGLTQIAIPPDTSLQRVYYENIDPKPKRVYLDNDGNWLAEFLLPPKEKIDVKVLGSVQIFTKPRKLLAVSAHVLNENTKPKEFWQSDDPQIKELASSLKTPEEIYKFVTNYLNYNEERVKPNVVRLGAKAALVSPNNAICMEFTDLFIAIARAAGIPAREINGFADTDNPKIQPLSLVADVLHSWPEYWNKDLETWIPVDPTWGATSGNDYFNKLDLKHITFVIHGSDSTLPYAPGSYKLGPNPQKDVFIAIGSLPEKNRPNIKIEYDLKNKFFIFNKELLIRVTNSGASQAFNLNPKIFFDGKLTKEENIQSLPPYGEHRISLDIPSLIFSNKSPKEVLVTVDSVQTYIDNKSYNIVILRLVVIFILIFLTLFIFLIKSHKLNLKYYVSYLISKKNKS